MALMAKIREVEESPSQDFSSSSSDAMKEVTATLTARPQTPEALLKARERILQLPEDEEPGSIRSLESLLSDTLWPPPSQAEKRDSLQLAEAALACLDALTSHWFPVNLQPQTLLRITAFTSPLGTSQIALSILSRAFRSDDGQQRKTAFIVDIILQSYLRPLFSKSSAKLTPAGRPAAYQDPTPLPDTRLNQETPAWKKEGLRAVAVFRWAAENADETLIKENWPLFTPVLLTIAEAEDPATRLSGLEILVPFVRKCPSSILHTTGIATVFEEAVFPSLLHLPSLTPEPESVRITTAAYAVLTTLVEKHEDPTSAPRRQLLDKILRRGIFTAYDHASQYVGIVEVLMRTTTTVVNLMGIHAVKHLQNLLSVISAVMTDPFMISHPATIMEATRGLNACISTCWPRLVTNEQEQGRLIRIISVCWINMHDGDPLSRPSSEDRSVLAEELKGTAQMINALQKQPPPEMAAILTREPLLYKLFQA